jgi:RNA polymerase sigma factor (sigma-70 family)
MAENDDLSLMKRLQAGDESALSLIMERYEGPLFRFIYRYVENETEAADILELTFVKVYQNRKRYRPTAKFNTWLYTIAGNQCKDHARKKRRRPGDFAGRTDQSEMLAAASSSVTAESAPLPSETASRNEEREMLHRAIRGLPHELRMALVLFSLEGKSQDEVAGILGCTAKAVESRVYRAKKLLEARLGRGLGTRRRSMD